MLLSIATLPQDPKIASAGQPRRSARYRARATQHLLDPWLTWRDFWLQPVSSTWLRLLLQLITSKHKPHSR